MSPHVTRRIEGRNLHVMLIIPPDERGQCSRVIDLTPAQAEHLRDELDRASLPPDTCRWCANLAEWGDLCSPCSDAEDAERGVTA